MDQAFSYSKRLTYTTLAFLLSDALAVTICGIISVEIRYFFQGQFDPAMYYDHWPVIFLFLLIYAGMGLYPGVLTPPAEELKKSFWASSLMFLALAAGTFLSKDGHLYSRGIFLMCWAMTAAAVPLARSVVRNYAATKPWFGFRAVVFNARQDDGAGDIVLRTLQRHPRMGLAPVLVVQPEVEQEMFGLKSCSLQSFMEQSEKYSDAYAVVVMAEDRMAEAQTIIKECGRRFQKIILAPNLTVQASLWASTIDFGGILGLELKQKLLDKKRLILKRSFDVIVALLLFALLSPFLLVLAFVVRKDSAGQAIFCHKRIGKNGNEFILYKFRTMVCNGDALLQNYLDANPERQSEWEKNRKLKRDPRVTSLGRFLRKYSLDELPQLWNVIKGDISLVGPRPIIAAEVEEYSGSYETYKRVRPGVTGLWQISGRNNTTYSERVDLDTYYVNNWSIWLDIYILCRTLPIVLRGEGAY